jgi:hypothetical protein
MISSFQSPMSKLDTDTLFEELETDAEHCFHDIEMEKGCADCIAKEVSALGSALKEHEVSIDISSKHIPILIRTF